jgi:hypothetical protein
MNCCTVCCENYNKTLHSKVICYKCNFDSCKKCVRYYLTHTIKNPHCMNCKEEWERDFLIENLNGSFVNKTYKKYRTAVLFDREKAQFPETMHLVEKETQIRDLHKINQTHIDKIQELQENIRKNNHDIYLIRRNGVPKDKKTIFIKACPADGCKGMLSSAHKCGICNIWACSKCFEVKGYQKDSPHTCKEENIKSAEMIKKETKNCPGCASLIYKISGCSQMWCTQCKIAFDWRTGEIETGVIHNPHFYEWQKQTGNNIRNPTEVPCGGIPGYGDFRTKLRYHKQNMSLTTFNWCFAFHRFANHWQHYEIRNLRRDCRALQNNSGLRIKYLMNEISLISFKDKVQKNEKQRNKKMAVLHIYELMNTVFTESLVDIYNKNIEEQILKNMDRIEKLITYSNNELSRISYIYSQSVSLLGNTFGYCRKKFNKKTYLLHNEKYKKSMQNDEQTDGETKQAENVIL